MDDDKYLTDDRCILTNDNVISGGKRCNIAEHIDIPGYWISRGKTEYIDTAEGTWQEWVELARRILEIDEKSKHQVSS